MRLVALGLALFGLTACTGALEVERRLDADEALYTSLYPYYAEVCAVSEFHKKPGFGAKVESGGPGGHAVLYLNGVCRDKGAGYPTIALCDGTPAPGQGVGLSANAHYQNANWAATEGRDLFFQGNLTPTERLTRLAYRRARDLAEAQGVLDGIEFHREVFDDMPADMSRRDFMYDVSMGTDFAVGFARDRYCARVPLDRAKMARVVGYLNGLNEKYRDGRRPFEWNVLRNNCSHLTHNALSAAGVWDEWEADRFVLIAALSFPVPKNEFVNQMRRTNDLPLDDVEALYADAAVRESVLHDAWLPTGAGALAEARPVIRDNDVYDTDLNLIFYDDYLLGPYRRRFREILAEPRYFDLRANLRHFAALYGRIGQTRKPVAWYLGHRDMAPAERARFSRFYERLDQALARDRAAVEAGLGALGAASR